MNLWGAAPLFIQRDAAHASASSLSASRHVTLFDYLGIPAIVGGGMATALFVLSLFFVSVYSQDGRKLSFFSGDFWTHRILASGAWTLGDSWATNITTILTIIGTVLGTSTALSAFFPGVAVDRFAIVNITAGGIVAASPLVFGILYTSWGHSDPSITDNATVTLPSVIATIMATLDASAVVRLPKNTAVTDPAGRVFRLRVGTRADLSSPASVLLPGDTTTRLDAQATATLPAGARAALTNQTLVSYRGGRLFRRADSAEQPGGTLVGLAARGLAALPVDTEVRVPGGATATLPAGAARAPLQASTEVRLPGGRVGSVPAMTEIDLPAKGTATLPAETRVRASGGRPVTFPRGAEVRLPADSLASLGLPAGTLVTVLPGAIATLDPGATARLGSVADGPSAIIGVASGAGITVPGGATVSAADSAGPDAQPHRVKVGQTIPVPPEATSARPRELPSRSRATANITVQGGSALVIGGSADVLTIPADCMALPDPPAHPGRPALLGRSAMPSARMASARMASARMASPRTRGQRIRLSPTPSASQLPAAPKSPRRPPPMSRCPGAPWSLRQVGRLGTLSKERILHLPQGASVIVANLRTVLIAAFVTMFGIGAEIGVVAVLVCGLSEASTNGRWIMFGALVVAAAVLLVYSVSAARMIANPQPGSSLSSAPGTSFTL